MAIARSRIGVDPEDYKYTGHSLRIGAASDVPDHYVYGEERGSHIVRCHPPREVGDAHSSIFGDVACRTAPRLEARRPPDSTSHRSTQTGARVGLA